MVGNRSHAEYAKLLEFVGKMRTWWRSKWDEARKAGWLTNDDGVSAVYRLLADQLEADLVDSEYNEKRDEVAVCLASQLYRTTYATAPADEFGNRRNFHDGLLWTSALGEHFLNALDNAGLTGKTYTVLLVPGVDSAIPRDVIVSDGQYVSDPAEGGKHIGLVKGGMKDGKYRLEGGYISVTPVHPSLRSMAWKRDPKSVKDLGPDTGIERVRILE
jgi:hypothetical protein